MANHVRQQIREAVASAVTGLSTTGANVFQSRVYPIQPSELPCLIVTTDGDRREYMSIHNPAQVEVEVIVRVEGYAQAISNLDDTLDTISKEVETAIAGASIADSVECDGTQIDESAIGDKPVGRVSIAYRMKTYILSNAPDVSL